MFDSSADRAEIHAQTRQLLRKTTLSQHEQRIDAMMARLRNHTQIQASGYEWKARSVRGAEVAFVDADGRFLLALASPVTAYDSKARDFRNLAAIEATGSHDAEVERVRGRIIEAAKDLGARLR